MAQRTAIDPICTFFVAVHAPRRQPPTTLPPLATMLTITILATMCGAQPGVEIAYWGQAKEAWRAELLALTQGMPSHATFGRVLAGLAPANLQQALVAWMKALAGLSQAIVALEGQTIRRSLDRADGTGPMHVMNAWASARAIVLAPFTGDANTHEITALPAWLRRLKVAGAVGPIETLGCQVEIARQMQAQGADDVRSCQEHPPRWSRDGDDRCTWRRGVHPLDPPVALGHDAQVAGGHGCLETRRVGRTAAPEGVIAGERWPGLTSLVMVESIRPLGDEARVERRDYLSSLPGATDADAQRLNRVHWVVDGAMGEDVNCTRKGESAQNLARIRKPALNLWRQEPSVEAGIAAKQTRAGWDHDYLRKILSQI